MPGLNTEPEYLRYRLTESGVSALAAPGDADQRFTADGLEHNQKGNPSAGDADHQQQLEKRQRKLTGFAYGDGWAVCDGQGEVALICFGSASTAVAEAAELLHDRGIATRTIALRLLAPLQRSQLTEALAGCSQAVVVEQNHGAQLLHYLRGQLDFEQVLHSYAVAGPVPLSGGRIADYVAEVIADE